VKEVWFKHDCYARHDPKIILLRAKYGAAGYGVYWMLIETFREADGYIFPKKHLPALCLDFAYDGVNGLVTDCIEEYDLFDEDGEFVWSPSLLQRMEKLDSTRAIRAEAGRKGGKTKANGKQNPSKRKRLDKIREEKKEDKSSGVVDEVFEFFRQKTGSKVRSTTQSLRSCIQARLDDGYTLDDCKKAIMFSYASKKDNPEQRQYIRIDTIFRPSKFSGYLDAWHREVTDGL